MKLFRSLLAGTLMVASVSFAQITVQATDFSAPGMSFTTHHSDSAAAFSVGSAGANQTWTFGTYVWSETFPVSYVNPASTPQGSHFANATRAVYQQLGSNDDTYIYERITSDAYAWLGIAGESADEILLYSQVAVMYPLPLAYNASWTTLQSWTIDAGGFTLISQDSIVSHVDGWGTVTTPYGSWPALRVFSHHWFTESMGGTPFMNFEYVQYGWLNQQGNVVLGLTADMGVTDPNFSHGKVEMMQSSLATEPPSSSLANHFLLQQNYPNPFNPSTDIRFELPQQTHVQLTIYNSMGQAVATLVDETRPAGTCTVTWDGHGQNGAPLASGLYVYRMTAGAVSESKTMILMK